MRNSIQFDCKTNSEDCSTLDWNEIPVSTAKEIQNLPWVNYDEMDDGNNKGIDLSEIYISTNAQYQVIKLNGKIYLINNEGFDYARYAVELINVEKGDLAILK